MKKLTQFTIVIALLTLVVSYQNCAQQDFKTEPIPTDTGALKDNDLIVTLDFKSKPLALSNLRRSVFEIKMSAQDSVKVDHLEYNLNNLGWKPVLLVIDTQDTLAGNNSIEVRAVLKKAGTYSDSIKYFWYIDDEVPGIELTMTPPTVTSNYQVEFSFVGTELLTRIVEWNCQFDGVIVEPCVSPYTTPNLIKGPHQFMVRAKDTAGNISPWVTHNFQFSPNVKSIRLTTFPESLTQSQSASFAFDQTGNGANLISFQCQLDQAQFQTCPQNLVYTNLSEGLHTFEIKGADALGNISETVSIQWTIDLTAPVIQFSSPSNAVLETSPPIDPAEIILSSEPILAFMASDSNGIAEIECAFSSIEDFASCQSPIDRRKIDSSGGIKNYRVRVTDLVGNVATKSLWFRSVETNIPFITINFAGGIGFNGNMIVLNKNSELLPQYGKMGLGSAANLVGHIENSYGMNWYTDSGILAGIKMHVTEADAAKVRFFAIANKSEIDTSLNKLYAGGVIARAGLKGTHLGVLGSSGSFNTGVYQQDALGATTNAKHISAYYSYPQITGVSFTPIGDLIYSNLFPNLQNSNFDQAIASQIYNSLNGNAGPVGINSGGYDYHTSDLTYIRQRDIAAGEIIGKAVKLALLSGKKAMINLTTDGGNIAPMNDLPGVPWSTDRKDNVQMFVVVDPTGSHTYGNYMIGAYDHEQNVDISSVAYDNPEKAVAIVVCNYVFFNGKDDCALQTNNILTESEIQKNPSDQRTLNTPSPL